MALYRCKTAFGRTIKSARSLLSLEKFVEKQAFFSGFPTRIYKAFLTII
jgi:hypothetical protein